MEIAFRQINIDDFELCVAARKDAYFCSFGHYDGFDDFISGYRERVLDRLCASHLLTAEFSWFRTRSKSAGLYCKHFE